MRFKDLEIGAIFRFGDDEITYIKVDVNSCKDVFGGICSISGQAECFRDSRFQAEIKFSNLAVGEVFRFLGGSKMQYTKTTEDAYCVMKNHRPLGSNIRCVRRGRKCISDSRTKFESLEVGMWFRYQTECFMKIGPTRVRVRGSTRQSYFRQDRLVESLTFEEVEK